MEKQKRTFAEFLWEYEERHRASVPVLEEEENIYPWWLEYVVAVMFIAGSMLSGVHTVPAVRAGMDTNFWPQVVVDAVALASYVAVELVFFIGAYALMRKNDWYVLFTLFAAFVVAMVSNIDQNVTAYQSGDPGKVIVAVLLGIGAPFIAFMAGKMFVNIHRSRRQLGIEAKRRYKEERIAFEERVGMLYTDYELQWAAYEQKLERSEKRKRKPTEQPSREPFTNVREQPRRRVNLHEVADEIHENGDTNLTSTEMMAKYKIGQGSTTKVREILRRKNYTNGGLHQ